MNIVFMGTPTYALPILSALAEKHTVTAVFSRPDAASDRGKKLLPSLVKARAEELGIPTATPGSFYINCNDAQEKIVDTEILAEIERHNPDVIVVAAFGMLLPTEVLDLPPLGCINLHASLLPRWRGAAPIQRALLAGDEQVGVSIMRMEAELDTGPYCLQAATAAQGKSYQQLIVELGEMAAKLLLPNLEAIVSGSVAWVEQDQSLVTYADKIEKGSINLDPELTVEENYNRVRTSSHHARCKALIHDRSVMILEARPAGSQNSKGVYFECSNGMLEIQLLKPDGSREMTGTAFLAGLR